MKERFANALAGAGVLGLLVIALATMADVLLRWLFNAPLQGLEDLSGLLIVFVLSAFFPAVLIGRGNVAITLLGRLAGPRTERVLEVFAHGVTLVFFALVAWQMARYAASLEGRITQILGLPVAPVWWLAAGLMLFAAFAQALVFLETVKSPKPSETEAGL